jgi:hypothetical protein
VLLADRLQEASEVARRKIMQRKFAIVYRAGISTANNEFANVDRWMYICDVPSSNWRTSSPCHQSVFFYRVWKVRRHLCWHIFKCLMSCCTVTLFCILCILISRFWIHFYIDL